MTNALTSHWLAPALALLAACGGDDTPDAGSDAGGDAAIGHSPALPIFTPCPGGWVEETADDVTTCSPWATPPPEACGVDEGVFPGEPGCMRVGTPCPAGDFPEGLPTDRRIVYVLAGAPAGGTGSVDAPFATIGSSFGSVFRNTIVAIGKGTYDEIVRPGDEVTLWGACPAETVIRSSVPEVGGAVIETIASGVVVHNLRIGESERWGILCQSGCSMSLEDVVVERATAAGVQAILKSEMTLANVVVRDTRPDARGEFGRGLNAEYGSIVTGARILSERNHELGIAAFGDGSIVRIEDVVVRGTLPQEVDGELGRGVSIEEGARIELTRAVVERNHDMAIFANTAGSSLLATDVVVRDTETIVLGRFGRGINAQYGAAVELHRVVVERSVEVGLYAGFDATSTAVDVVVRDGQPLADDASGFGVVAEAGGRSSLDRAVVARSLGEAVLAIDATVRLTDVTVTTIGRFGCASSVCPDAAYAVGLGAVGGGSLEATSFRIFGSEICGVLVAEEGTMTLSTGEVGGSEIGACIQVPGFDIAQLMDRVAYVDNGSNLDTTDLPVPTPLGAR